MRRSTRGRAAAEAADETLKPLTGLRAVIESLRQWLAGEQAAAVPQLLNYLNVTQLPLGLVLFFGPKHKVKRVIRDPKREYPVRSR